MVSRARQSASVGTGHRAAWALVDALVAVSGLVPVALSGRDVRSLAHPTCIRIVSTRHCIQPGSRGGRREAYIPAKYTQTCQEARVSLPHEHPRRSRRAQEPSRQGPRPTLGLIGRIRERHAFVRLGRHGTRIRRSALWCSWCPDPESTATSVAFAINRAYGPAVIRNRLRRRLRSILRELDRIEPLPPILLLIGAQPSLREHTFDQLRQELGAMIEQIRSQQPPVEPRR